MLRTHRARKGPGGCGGWGLGSRNRRGLRGQGPLVSEGGGTHQGAQQASWAQVASPDLPGLPLLISPASLLCPKGPTWLGGGFGVGVLAWELSRLPGPSRPGDHPLLLSCSSWRVPLAYPDLPGLTGANPVWPPLLLSPSVPLRPTSSLGGSSRLLGCQGPPPAAGTP